MQIKPTRDQMVSLRPLRLALTVIRRIVDIAAIILLCAMVAFVLSQVLGRYVFNYAISWSEESATFVQVWLVMLGAGIAMRNRQHVGIDLIIVRCPVAVQRLVKGAGLVLASWFLVVVIIGSISMMSLGMVVISPALQLPMAVPYMALPVGMSYLLLELVVATVAELIDPTNVPSSPGEVE